MNPTEVFQLAETELKPGTSLIEASAGTGKTFTIAGVFLRLLLEHALSVDQILVVTYTVAATEELRGRIRRTLKSACRTLEAGEGAGAGRGVGEDVLLRKFRGRSQAERHEWGAQLELALRRFDQAPIFTIHGFCQRALRDRAFESGGLFDTEVISDQSDLVQEVLDDIWR